MMQRRSVLLILVLNFQRIVDMVPDDSNPGKSTLLLTGYIRAHSLSVNRPVHVSGVGDFLLSKIDIVMDPIPLNGRKVHDAMDFDDIQEVEVIRSLAPDPLNQEPLLVQNVPDPLAGEQTWPTEAEMAEADRNQKQKRLRKRALPRGTSKNQAAWIIDDTDKEDSDAEDDGDDDEGDDSMVLDEGESGFPSQEGNNYPDFDEDQVYSDEETESDSAMMNFQMKWILR